MQKQSKSKQKKQSIIHSRMSTYSAIKKLKPQTKNIVFIDPKQEIVEYSKKNMIFFIRRKGK